MFVEVKERLLAPIEIPSFDWKAAAKRKIRERGWWHAGSLPDPRSVCLGVAVMAVGGNKALSQVAYKIKGYVDADHAAEMVTIGQWNDAPERTLSEVLAMIDSA